MPACAAPTGLCRQYLGNLPANAPEATGGLVEMEMVGVGRVVVWRKYGTEYPASLVTGTVKERCLLVFTVPIAQHADPSSVGQNESGNIDGVAGRMLAPASLGPSIEAAAAVSPEVLDPGDGRAQLFFCSGLHALSQPQHQRSTDSAGGRRGIRREGSIAENRTILPAAFTLAC